MGRPLVTIVGVAWAIGLPRVVLSQPALGDCAPNTVTVTVDDCPEVGTPQLVATIVLTNASEPISGGQFFLRYSTSVFELVSVEPAEDPSPFTCELFSELDYPTVGDIGYGVLIPGGAGTMDDNIMCKITFLVVSEEGDPFIRFRDDHPRHTRLSTLVDPWFLVPHMADAGDHESVDLADVAAFQNCFSGEDVAAEAVCACLFDYDEDLDVDLADHETLRGHMTGPLPFNSACP